MSVIWEKYYNWLYKFRSWERGSNNYFFTTFRSPYKCPECNAVGDYDYLVAPFIHDPAVYYLLTCMNISRNSISGKIWRHICPETYRFTVNKNSFQFKDILIKRDRVTFVIKNPSENVTSWSIPIKNMYLSYCPKCLNARHSDSYWFVKFLFQTDAFNYSVILQNHGWETNDYIILEKLKEKYKEVLLLASLAEKIGKHINN